MCSLYGWLSYKNIVPNRMLKRLTQSLANAAEERGTDATGIGYISGCDVIIYKRPKPAHKIHFIIPAGTTAVMGHTRMTTQGSAKHNYNNHPFPGSAGDTAFAFAHNGVLYNDTELKREKKLPATKIKTDSYVAVQLLEQYGKLDFAALKEMAETVEGNFTFTVLDESNNIYIIKGNNPMCLLHFKTIGLYIYASTETIMKKTLHETGFDKFGRECIETNDGDILKIDKFGEITRSEFTLKKFTRYSRWLDNPLEYYTAHEELLLTYCNCYGVDSENVELLLSYGYTCMEIEEMFTDTDLLHETISAIKFQEEEDSPYGRLYI